MQEKLFGEKSQFAKNKKLHQKLKKQINQGKYANFNQKLGFTLFDDKSSPDYGLQINLGDSYRDELHQVFEEPEHFSGKGFCFPNSNATKHVKIGKETGQFVFSSNDESPQLLLVNDNH